MISSAFCAVMGVAMMIAGWALSVHTGHPLDERGEQLAPYVFALGALSILAAVC